jgi:hypothetical protein
MQIPFSWNLALSIMVRPFFVVTFNSCILISMAFSCASINAYIFVDGCTSIMIMFSSLASIFIVYASTNCYSIALSSSNYSMNIGSINVALGLVYTFACQCFLLLHKNSTTNVFVWFMSWIIVCEIVSFHCMFFLLHILRIMKNATVTL